MTDTITEKLQNTTLRENNSKDNSNNNSISDNNRTNNNTDIPNTNNDVQCVRNIIFIGHVDAGKSTICGRMLVDLNLIEERVLEKYKQQAAECNRTNWYLSWCMDLNPEEREKGKTQEISVTSIYYSKEKGSNNNNNSNNNITNNNNTSNNIISGSSNNTSNGDIASDTMSSPVFTTKINIIDSPGHKAYVHEMIEGASRADIGVLIVSARSEEFEAGFKRGQTKEHLRLLKASNVPGLIVLVNKMDECNWDKSKYLTICEKISKFISKLYPGEIRMIPVSGFTGENIIHKKQLDYYKYESFIDELVKCNSAIKSEGMSALVVEKFKGNINQYAIKLNSGTIQKNTAYKLISGTGSASSNISISDIKDDDDVDIDNTVTNDIYKVLVSVKDDIPVGSRIVDVDNCTVYSTNSIVAILGVYSDVSKCITVGYTGVLHFNGTQTPCKIKGIYDKNKKAQRVAKKGEKVIVTLEVEEGIVISKREKVEERERFSIRDEDETIGVGEIVKGK